MTHAANIAIVIEALIQMREQAGEGARATFNRHIERLADAQYALEPPRSSAYQAGFAAGQAEQPARPDGWSIPDYHRGYAAGFEQREIAQ